MIPWKMCSVAENKGHEVERRHFHPAISFNTTVVPVDSLDLLWYKGATVAGEYFRAEY